MLSIVSFDKTPRSFIERGTIMHHLMKHHQLYNDGYQLRRKRVRGLNNIALYAPTPGEEDRPREYRPVLTGRRALKVAIAIAQETPWTLDDNPRVHEVWQEHGTYEPDYNDPPDVLEYGY